MRKNIWTTLFGVMAALPQLVHLVGVESFGHIGTMSVDNFLSGIGMLGVGVMAKQFNVTGGTVPQTSEAAERVEK